MNGEDAERIAFLNDMRTELNRIRGDVSKVLTSMYEYNYRYPLTTPEMEGMLTEDALDSIRMRRMVHNMMTGIREDIELICDGIKNMERERK